MKKLKNFYGNLIKFINISFINIIYIMFLKISRLFKRENFSLIYLNMKRVCHYIS